MTHSFGGINDLFSLQLLTVVLKAQVTLGPAELDFPGGKAPVGEQCFQTGYNQPSHPLLSPSPPALNLSQHQGLFQRASPSHQVAKVLELQF